MKVRASAFLMRKLTSGMKIILGLPMFSSQLMHRIFVPSISVKQVKKYNTLAPEDTIDEALST
jgi:hypothetical protein